jgi:hypothetical protein
MLPTLTSYSILFITAFENKKHKLSIHGSAGKRQIDNLIIHDEAIIKQSQVYVDTWKLFKFPDIGIFIE